MYSFRTIARLRRAQLSIRHGRRNYDRNIAGLGIGRAPRYFAFDFERISDRSFVVCKIEALEVVVSSTAVLHALSQYSNAVLDREKIDEGELHEAARIYSNRLKRKENALILSHGSFVDPKIDWTDSNYKAK